MGKAEKHKFTIQQMAFVDSYMVHFSATRAAQEAKYKNPTKYAWELLGMPHIAEEIKKRSNSYANSRMALKDRVVEELCSIAFASLNEAGELNSSGFTIKDEDDIPETTKRAISEYSVSVTDKSVTTKIKMHNKTQALDLLGKHLGMFKDNEVKVNIVPYIIKRRNGSEIELGVRN